MEYNLPQIIDLEQDTVTVTINYGEAITFSKYFDGSFTFSPLEVSNSEIKVKLTDNNKDGIKSSEYSFKVNVKTFYE